jgi:hypothetical protein
MSPVDENALIAPCGMNCGVCMAYLREKNKCPGCRLINVRVAGYLMQRNQLVLLDVKLRTVKFLKTEKLSSVSSAKIHPAGI